MSPNPVGQSLGRGGVVFPYGGFGASAYETKAIRLTGHRQTEKEAKHRLRLFFRPFPEKFCATGLTQFVMGVDITQSIRNRSFRACRDATHLSLHLKLFYLEYLLTGNISTVMVILSIVKMFTNHKPVRQETVPHRIERNEAVNRQQN